MSAQQNRGVYAVKIDTNGVRLVVDGKPDAMPHEHFSCFKDAEVKDILNLKQVSENRVY